MLTAVGLVPSAPLLVPELSGAKSPEADTVRASTLRVGHVLAAQADHWTIVGTGIASQPIATSGTFRGFGADVPVSLTASARGLPDARMPLPLLIGAWLRGQVAPYIDAATELIAPTATSADCRASATALWGRLAESPAREAVLFVADGSTMLTPRAPGAFRPGAGEFQQEVDLVIERGDLGRMDAIDPAECEEFGAGLGVRSLRTLVALVDRWDSYVTSGECAAPFGVGYHFRTWSR